MVTLVFDTKVKCRASNVGCTLFHLEEIETWLNTFNIETAIIMEDYCDIALGIIIVLIGILGILQSIVVAFNFA